MLTILTLGLYFAKARSSSAIWLVNSRVGDKIKHCSASLSSSIRSRIGMPNAQVFPVPVGAFAITSRFSIISGMVFSCTSVNSVNPISATAFLVCSNKESSSNLIFFIPSGPHVPSQFIYKRKISSLFGTFTNRLSQCHGRDRAQFFFSVYHGRFSLASNALSFCKIWSKFRLNCGFFIVGGQALWYNFQ